MRKERINYFDIAKGLGIILVVLGHLEYISINVRYAIVSFHMPLFFVISGMLMNISKEEKRDMKSYIKGKAKRIMVPYISFSILDLVIIIALIFISSDYTWTYFFENVYLFICLYGISVMWFLPAMFFSSILFVLIRKKFSHLWTLILVIVSTVAAFYLNCGLEYLNISYSKDFVFYHLHLFLVMILRIFFCTAFLCAGYYFYNIFKLIKIKPIFDFIIGALLLTGVAFLSQINLAVDLHFLVFNIWYIYLICSLTGSFAIMFISRSMEGLSDFAPLRLLRYYGKNSLIIMSTHMDAYIMYAAILISLRFIDYVSRAKSYVFCFSIVLIVFIIEIPVIEIINRYFPFFAGISRRSFDTK